MGVRTQKGFTIIESVLFLAISGVLIIALIVGAGASLNAQRYKDSVETFKNLLQSQYADLASVQNGRDNSWTCDSSANISTGGDVRRGQSECLLLGKYMRIEGGDITIYTVLGRETTTLINPADDLDVLLNGYALNASTTQIEEKEMEWGTEIAWPATGTGSRSPQTPRQIGLLFIRSPHTGQVYTFSSDVIPAKTAVNQSTFTQLLVGGASIPGQGNRTICIASDGLLANDNTAIFINAYATTPSAIEVRTDELATGSEPKC